MSQEEGLEQHQSSVSPPRHSPGPGRHLHAGVEGWFTLKVVHDDAVVAVDDVLVDALPPEVLQNLVDAVNTVQDGLEQKEEEEEEERGGRKNTALLLAVMLHKCVYRCFPSFSFFYLHFPEDVYIQSWKSALCAIRGQLHLIVNTLLPQPGGGSALSETFHHSMEPQWETRQPEHHQQPAADTFLTGWLAGCVT